jgi:hypothetical protein
MHDFAIIGLGLLLLVFNNPIKSGEESWRQSRNQATNIMPLESILEILQKFISIAYFE